MELQIPGRIVWRKSRTLSHAASAFLGVTETAAPKLAAPYIFVAIDAL